MARKRRAESVAARMTRLRAQLPAEVVPRGVQPLNPGYFLVERIRTQARPKVKSAVRKQLESK